MKMPWTKAIATAIKELEQKMQRTFDKVSNVILEQDKLTHEKSLHQLNIFKRSEQIKYNRIKADLEELKACFQAELNHYRKGHVEREKAAARDAENGHQ